MFEQHFKNIDDILRKDAGASSELDYIERGVGELDEEKLPQLLNLKYHAIADAIDTLGDVDFICSTYFDFQRSLYSGAK